MERTRIFVRILTTCIFLISGCSRATDSGILRYQLGAEPVSLDPALAEDGVSLEVLGNTMWGLVGYDGKGTLQNRIAKSYLISPDGKRYEFTLREDAKWSDGKPVLASQFIAAFRRTLSPSSLSKLSPLFLSIKGAQAYHKGSLGPEGLGVREEAGRLVIELERPIYYFLQALTLTAAMPVRSELIEGGRWLDSSPTTGPYFISKHVTDEKIVLERNPYFFEKVCIPKIELWIVPDENTGANLFEEGRMDILSRVPGSDIPRYRKEKKIRSSAFYATYYLAFNIEKTPFDQATNRRLVAASIDKAEIVKSLDSGERVAESFVPYGLEGYFSKKLSFPPAGAKAFSKTPAVDLDFDSSSRNTMILEKVQNDLENRLSLKINLNNMDWKTFVRTIQTDASPIYRFGLLAPFKDPIVHLQFFTSDSPNNCTHWKNADYDRLVRQIESLPPSSARAELIKKAQYILEVNAAVVIPIYHYVQNMAVSDRVSNFSANPFGEVLFSELSLKQ